LEDIEDLSQLFERHAKQVQVEKESHEVPQGDLSLNRQAAAIPHDNNEADGGLERNQRAEKSRQTDVPCLLGDDAVEALLEALLKYLLVSECLDRANSPDVLLYRLGHTPKGFLIADGLRFDLGTEGPHDDGNEEEREKPRQHQAPVHVDCHHVERGGQQRKAVYCLAKAHGAKLADDFDIAKSVGEQVAHAVALVIGRCQGRPLGQKARAQFIDQASPMRVDVQTPYP
jgi:hypothetical protein